MVDEYLDRIGIRTFEIRHGRFLLNGSPVYLRGFGRHEDADIRGRGLDLPTVKRDFELMKWIGANCFRTSHYPYAEEIYQMADEEASLSLTKSPPWALCRAQPTSWPPIRATAGSRAFLRRRPRLRCSRTTRQP